MEQAARAVRARGGLAAAAALLERAIELTPGAAERGKRALSAALAKLLAADHEGGLKLIAIAELCPLDDVDRFRLERIRASLTSSVMSDEGSQLMLEAAKRLSPFDAQGARGAYLGALTTRSFLGRLGDGERLRQFAEAARAAPPGPDPPQVTDLLLDGVAARHLDGYRAALPLLRRAVDACVEVREPGARLAEWVVFVPSLPPETWDDQAWERLTAYLVAATKQAGGYLNYPMALDYRASFEVHAGRFAAAAAHLEASTAIKEATDSTPALTAMELAAWRGAEAEAVELIDGAIRFWTARVEGRWISLAEYARAALFNGLGRYDQAADAARRACEHDDIGIHGWALAELVEACVRNGDRAAAEDGLRRLEQRTSAAATAWALGVEARSRALLAGDDAEALHREAIERLAGTLMEVDLARSRLVYGEWLRRANRRADAREHLRVAYQDFERIGASAFADRARRELLATGQTVGARSIGPSVVLTPQERQVARLAGERHTNAEIGAQLFISPRTVEYHLAKVFTKLGVSSRRELPKALQDHG